MVQNAAEGNLQESIRSIETSHSPEFSKLRTSVWSILILIETMWIGTVGREGILTTNMRETSLEPIDFPCIRELGHRTRDPKRKPLVEKAPITLLIRFVDY